MINNYSLKEKELEIEYNNKMKEIEQKEKDFWKKEV